MKINEYLGTGPWPEELRKVDRNAEKEASDEMSRLLPGTQGETAAEVPATKENRTGQGKRNTSNEETKAAEETGKEPREVALFHKKARKAYLKLAKSKKWAQAKCSKAIGEQLGYIALATKRLKPLKNQVLDFALRFSHWLQDRFDVIPLVYAQQKEMFDKKAHVCAGRIISLQQPHIAPLPVESILILLNSVRSSTFPWWTALLFWK